MAELALARSRPGPGPALQQLDIAVAVLDRAHAVAVADVFAEAEDGFGVDRRRGGRIELGLVGAVGGVGAVLGAAVTTAIGRRLGTGRTIILCHLLITGAVVVMVLSGQTPYAAWVLGLGQGLYGLAMGMSNSHEMSYRQLVTPDELQARTNTTLRSLNRAVVVVVAPVAGLLADAVGIETMLVVAAAFVWSRGPDRHQEAIDDVVDVGAAEALHATLGTAGREPEAAPVPALEG